MSSTTIKLPICLLLAVTGLPLNLSAIFQLNFSSTLLGSTALAQRIDNIQANPDELLPASLEKSRTRQFQKKLYFGGQAFADYQQTGDRQGGATSLNNLGLIYNNLAEYERAIDFYRQSLTIAREIGDRQGEATSLNNLGNAYNNLAEYEEAIDFYRPSLVIARETGDRQSEAVSLGNLGNAYNNLEEYERAIDFYRQSLVIAREIGDRQSEAASLNNLGNAYNNLAEYEQAIDFYQQSLVIAREIDDRQSEATFINNLGKVYALLEEDSKAKDFYKQSLVIAREIDDRQGEVASLNNLGLIYNNLEEYEQAIDFYKQSLVITILIDDDLGLANSLNNIGLAFKNSGNLTKAKESFSQAINLLEKIRELQGTKDAWKVSIFEQQAHTYALLQEVLVAQNQHQKALEISERGRVRALVELSLRKLSPPPQEQFIPPSPNIAKIKKIAQEQNATLVEYSLVSNNQIYIWVISPTGEINFRSVDFPKNISLQELIKISRTSIAARGRGVKDSTPKKIDTINYLRELHQLLIEPIADLLPSNPEERLIFIPHKELFVVPFAALQDADYIYMIEKHTILTAPSIQALSLTRQHQKRVRNFSGEALVVGDPLMPQQQEREKFRPLPGAKKEAEKIAAILGTKPITGAEATETAIVQKMANAGVIHLATHGLLDDIDSSPGAIVLAPSAQEDGFLTTNEIMERFGLANTSPLQAELVVLSACDTGRGEIKGEGVIGLSRSFIAAGVPTIVVSLWKVPDAATEELMTDFYTNLYEKKLDNAQAMRQAMLNAINGGNPDPSAWAAFTVIGEAE